MELRELTQALADKKDVRWISPMYRVTWEDLPDGPAIVIRHENGFGGAMAISEINGCYVEEQDNE